ncbi:GNAT family N-acetyltransferase, partial [Mesorhizobium sp. M4B.F.Ca.ET.088.02.2.1]
AALTDMMRGTLHIDVPVANADFIAALGAAGLSPGFSTTRMYRGGAPANAQARVFGITTLELG